MIIMMNDDKSVNNISTSNLNTGHPNTFCIMLGKLSFNSCDFYNFKLLL